jgi:hypothetical protein
MVIIRLYIRRLVRYYLVDALRHLCSLQVLAQIWPTIIFPIICAVIAAPGRDRLWPMAIRRARHAPEISTIWRQIFALFQKAGRRARTILS